MNEFQQLCEGCLEDFFLLIIILEWMNLFSLSLFFISVLALAAPVGLEPPRPGTATVKLLQLSNRMPCDVKICIVRKPIRCYLPPPSSGSSCTLSFFPSPPPLAKPHFSFQIFLSVEMKVA